MGFRRLIVNQKLKLALAVSSVLAAVASNANAFEGRIEIVSLHASESIRLHYTVGKEFLRIEPIAAEPANPVNIVDLKSGVLTIMFPHNRSFVRLKSSAAGVAQPGHTKSNEPSATTAVAIPAVPAPRPPGALPPGVNPPTNGTPLRITPAMPVPAMPPMPSPTSKSGTIALKSTGAKEKILGFDCEKFEIKSSGETLEIWATDKLLPYQSYLSNPVRRFGPPMLEEQWSELLAAKKLFPLRVILHSDGNAVRSRFDVKSITPERIEDKDGKLFQPPPDYTEVPSLPF